MRIILDSISIFAALSAIMIGVYLYTFQIQIALAPVVLLTSAIALLTIYGKREEDESISGLEARQMIYWVAVGLGVMVISSYSTNYVFSTANLSTQKLDIVNAQLFTVLMAVSEEYFFRGFILTFFVNHTSPWFGILASSLTFMIYHLAVYHSSTSALAYVLIAGAVLSFITYKTKRLSPAIIAHVLNNLVA